MIKLNKQGNYIFIFLLIINIIAAVFLCANLKIISTALSSYIIFLLIFIYYLYCGKQAIRIVLIIHNILSITSMILIIILKLFISAYPDFKIIDMIIITSIYAVSIIILCLPILKKYMINNRKVYLEKKISKLTTELNSIKGNETSH